MKSHLLVTTEKGKEFVDCEGDLQSIKKALVEEMKKNEDFADMVIEASEEFQYYTLII